MANDQNRPFPERSVPGDEHAADIVGRTGEEMPEAAHDGAPAAEADKPPRTTSDDRKAPRR